MPFKPKRKLKKVDASFISLVTAGANNKSIIYKSKDYSEDANNFAKEIKILKTDEDQRMVFGIVYSPDEVDSQGDIATAEVIKEMAYNFQKNAHSNNVDKQHSFKGEEGFVAETWITKAGDNVFPTEKEGSWAVGIKIEKEETWALVKSGEIKGLSLAGVAEIEPIEDDEPDSFLQKIRKAFGLVAKTELKKDFNEELQKQQFKTTVYALYSSIDKVMYDESISDKKSMILENVSQFVNTLNGLPVTKSVVEIDKAGRVISANNLKKLQSALKEITDLISTASKSLTEEEDSNVQKNKKESDMTPEEIQNIVVEALKPITQELADLKKSIEDSKKELSERVEKVEKATPGSAQSQDPPATEAKDKIWI